MPHLGDQLEQVHLDPSACWTGDQLRLRPAPQLQATQQFLAVLHFVDRVGGVRNADGIPDTLGEQRGQGGDRSHPPGLRRTGVRDSQVQRVIKPLADRPVSLDHDDRVGALGGEHYVGKIVLFEKPDVLLQLADHELDEVPVTAPRQLLLLGCPQRAVLSLDHAAFVDAHADGDAGVAACSDDLVHLPTVLDVARVQSDLVCARGHRLQGSLVVKMHVRNDRDRALSDDLREGCRVLAVRYRHPYHVTSRGRQPVDLSHCRVDVVSVRAGHGLQAHRRLTSHRHFANADFSCLPSLVSEVFVFDCHGVCVLIRAQEKPGRAGTDKGGIVHPCGCDQAYP